MRVAEFPVASVAVMVTVVVPIGNVLPDSGLKLTVGEGSTRSITVGTSNTGSGYNVAPAISDARMPAL